MIDPTHPRAISLKTRDLIVSGVKRGITSQHGLIAQGRGEAFDYLLGEKTQSFALEAIEQAAKLLLAAKHPVLSINGNSAALAPKEFITLSRLLDCPIEINLFHRTYQRERAIEKYLRKLGATTLLGVGKQASSQIDGVASPRKRVSPQGIAQADVVFVPLEDGDRTEALIKNGKKVIAVDLNPLSRTAQKATVTIVDNLVRVLPILITHIKNQRNCSINEQQNIKKYNNQVILAEASSFITNHFSSQ